MIPRTYGVFVVIVIVDILIILSAISSFMSRNTLITYSWPTFSAPLLF